MKAEEFNKLNLEQRHELVKEKGEFVNTRYYFGFTVHLFTLEGLYIEVWQRAGLNYIQWIEVVNSAASLNSYLDNIDLNDLE
jgi:hypothetical protein